MNKFNKCALIFLLFSSAVAEAAPPQSVTDGQTSGGDAVRALSGMITNTQSNTITQSNSTTGADTTTVQDLQAQFAVSNGGNSGLGTQGSTQLDNCKNYVPNQVKLDMTPPDPVELARYQECTAVNDLAQQPLQNAIIKSGLTKSDSLFQNPDNMFNYGNTNAGTVAGGALELVGSGVGSSGGGTCVTTTDVTPATYATGSCTRSDLPNTQACQVTVAPTISTVPYCTIGGGTLANRPWPSWPWGTYATPGGTDVWSANQVRSCYNIMMGFTNYTACTSFYGSYHGTIVYKCRAKSDPLYALGGIAEYIQNPNWQTSGGGLNFTRPVVSVNFSVGLSSRISTASIINYLCWPVASTSMYYDGPTDQFYVSYQGDSQHVFAPLVSCAPGYKYVYPQTYTSSYLPQVCTTGDWGTICSAGSATIPDYCTKATEPTSLPVRQTSTVAEVVQSFYTIPAAYYSCDPNNPFGACTWNAPYRLTSGSLGFNGSCWNGPCTIQKMNPCANGRVLYEDPAGSWLGWCYPPALTVSLPAINTDRAVRQYAAATGHYTGEAGIKKVMDENIADSCAALQSQTSNPTATPAVAVNGVLTCPAGKTLSGTNCI